MEGIENIINVVLRISPALSIAWGVFLIALRKYQENHNSEIISKVVTVI
jgi:hypothetical protein